MEPLYFVLFSVASFYALWFCYLGVMCLKRARNEGKLHKTALVLGTPILIVGYILDCIVNLIPMSVIMLELPRELTVTARLQRHIRNGNGWRFSIAAWFIPLLDPFDPDGRHITEIVIVVSEPASGL